MSPSLEGGVCVVTAAVLNGLGQVKLADLRCEKERQGCCQKNCKKENECADEQGNSQGEASFGRCRTAIASRGQGRRHGSPQSGMASIFCNSLDSRLFERVISKELSGNSSHRWHGHALRKASSANALKFSCNRAG